MPLPLPQNALVGAVLFAHHPPAAEVLAADDRVTLVDTLIGAVRKVTVSEAAFHTRPLHHVSRALCSSFYCNRFPLGVCNRLDGHRPVPQVVTHTVQDAHPVVCIALASRFYRQQAGLGHHTLPSLRNLLVLGNRLVVWLSS